MKKKKKRIKIKSLIILISIIIIIALFIFIYFNLKLKNIYINGNDLISEYDIINISELKDYPNIYKINTRKIKKKLMDNKLISDVNIKKTLSSISINISEHKVVMYDNYNNKYILDNGEIIDNLDIIINGLPTIETIIDKTIYNNFIDSFNKVDKDILRSISEINYEPTDYDKERFLLYMNDQNYVYITLSKIKNINFYFDIIKQFNDKKGILYLDSGNHFITKN